jgi:filamentous hemagglutinin family protein
MILALVVALAALACGPSALANPQGMTIVSGSASARQSGSQLNVTVGQTTILNWSSFDIQAGETTRFLQPSSGSIIFNSIGGANPSKIWGRLTANGTVILANAHGFYFGPHSMIQVGGSFIATTASLPPDLGADGTWRFTGLPPLASIVNFGQIETGQGQSLFLIAEQVENHGELSTPSGSVGLYAGRQILVSERPDGRGLSATLTLPSGSVDNSGKIIADAGSIALSARVVNVNGLLQADSVRDRNGVIELVASDALTLGDEARLSARGDDATAGSQGGTVTLKSGNTFADTSGSRIETRGGLLGGNGGNVEISAPTILSLDSSMDAGAQAGWTGGKLLLDPVNIVLGTSGNGSPDDAGKVAYDSGSGTLNIDVNTAFANKNFSEIDLQASGNITLAQGTAWNLSASTGLTTGQLLLQAGGDIIFGNTAQIVDANNWSVNLRAGVNFDNNTVQSGAGNIYLNGGNGKSLTGSISTSQGSISLTAGQSILVGAGFVHTTGGGSIDATAIAGDINAGTANGGYLYSIYGYNVSTTLGGISTAAGGDVTLIAGNNITSIPTVPANQTPGASGAYGSQPGNVTLIAGNQILGNFTLANGVGTLLAGAQVGDSGVPQILNSGANVGSAQRPVNLGLIDGSWNVRAANNIWLNEVRNPNGTFNANRLAVPGGTFPGNTDGSEAPSKSSFLFDYAADAAANLWAGNGILLAGVNLPRISGQNQNMPPVYPPILSLDAGAGGVTIENSIVLFPSSQGSLHILTRNGGNLTGTQQQSALTGITMSDSGLPGWSTFAQGHAITSLHLNDTHPVTLDISGSFQSFSLTVPTFADIRVGGDAYNFGFVGRNLSASQTTSINVAGDITYRGNLTGVTLNDPLPAALFSPTLSADPGIALKLRYNRATQALTFIGQMTGEELNFLLNPAEIVLDKNGQRVTVPLTLSDAQKAAVEALYAASQSASLGDNGLALAGPGRFNISARNLDLGISGGISVLAPDPALAAISPNGASLNITLSGNLDMTSTKIANEGYLGSIRLVVGGSLDVGGEFTTFGDADAPKGIFTTSGGNVFVEGHGDVNVNGSRIAAYNGGNVTVESLTGDVNAGTGGSGYVTMSAVELNKSTGKFARIAASIPGSGILATTLARSSAELGNILVEAPNGNVEGSAGGILQVPFNHLNGSKTVTEILAGYELRDADGNRVEAGDIAKGTPVQVSDNRNIDAANSGILAQTLILKATGYIKGLFVGKKIIADAGKPFSGSPPVFVSKDPPKISMPPGDGSDSNPIIISEGSGKLNGATVASDAMGAAVARNNAETAETAAEAVAKDMEEGGLDSDLKNKGKSIALAQKSGRVTVILPAKD